MAPRAEPEVPRRPTPPRALVAQATASALLCGAALVVARLLGNSDIGGRPVMTLIGAAALATSAILASMIFGRGQVSSLTLGGLVAQDAREQLLQDDIVRLVTAQLGGTAVAGCVVGFSWPSITTMPELWSWATGRELLAACVLSCVAVSVRDRRGSAFKIAIVVAVASAAGSRFLGSPTLLIGSAFADVTRGVIAPIGAVLAAQTVGTLLGVAISRVLDQEPAPADMTL